MNKLEQIWRIFGTGLSFLAFGLGGLFLSVFVFPLIFLFIRNPDNAQRRARALIGRAFGAHVWMMKSLGTLSYTIRGMENAGSGQKQLIVANHPTLVDVVFLVSLFPWADCVIKEGVVKNPFMRGVVVPARYVSSDDPGELLDSCVARLKAGGNLLLFPEGTRSVYGHSLQFKPGAASVAVRSGAEILPITIQCSQPGFLAKHVAWYKAPPEQPCITIHIRKPVQLNDLIDENLDPRQATHALNEALVKYFEERIS